MKVNRITFLLIVSVVLAAGNACSMTKGKGLAEKAVVQFHEQFNAQRYREIYSQTDDEFKKFASEADFVALLEAVQRKLGAVKGSSPSGWGVNATTMGTMATLSYDVEFGEGKGQEQFVFRISNDRALLYRYNVNSPLLITR